MTLTRVQIDHPSADGQSLREHDARRSCIQKHFVTLSGKF